jgi:hypothetical protein
MNDALKPGHRLALTQAERAPACTFVIFGATGDLTRRLLVPALYNLVRWKLSPEDFRIIGVGRTEQDANAFRDGLTAAMRGYIEGGGDAASDGLDDAAWRSLAGGMDYLSGDLRTPGTLLRQQLTVERPGEPGPLGPEEGYANDDFHRQRDGAPLRRRSRYAAALVSAR